MKIDVKTEQKSEISENNVKSEPEDKEILQNTGMRFSELIDGLNGNNSDIQTASEIPMINGIIANADFKSDIFQISEEDAKFFLDLTQNTEFFAMPMQGNPGDISLVKAEVVQNTVSTKAVEVTNQIAELISKAKDTQKPVRIAFDNNISVVLKIDKQGKVTAEFIPGSNEAESFLRNNIASLRQRFDEQNLPYNDLFYRNNGRNGRQNKKRDDK